MFLTVAGPAAMVAPGPWKHPATHNRSRIAAGGKPAVASTRCTSSRS